MPNIIFLIFMSVSFGFLLGCWYGTSNAFKTTREIYQRGFDEIRKYKEGVKK